MKKISLMIALSALAYFAVGQDSNNVAVSNKATNYKAGLDHEFDKGSAITSIPLGTRRIDDLAVLGKVWGFVKYYHPAVCAGEFNWDYELFRVLPRVMQCNNDKERNEILSAWIKELGEFKTETIKQPDSAKVKLYPDLQWINDVAVLGDQLSAQLNEIRNAKRAFTGYYLGSAKAGNPDFKNENSYAGARYPDAGTRLLALYRYWNIIQYFFPYKYLIGENWNNVLVEFIPKVVKAGNELEYKETVLALIARIHDSHANFWYSEPAVENKLGKYHVPLIVSFVEGKVVVLGYTNAVVGEETGLKKGDVITTINGKSTDNIIKEHLPLTPASNYPTQLRNMAANLLRSNDTSITVTYQRGETVKTATLPCYPRHIAYVKNTQKDTCFKYLTPEIGYVYPGTIRKEYVSKVMPDFMKTKGIVIDMRCYPSDNVFGELAKYLLPKRTPFARFTHPDLVHPGYFLFTIYQAVGINNADYYKGRIVILVNEKTQSSAEFMAMSLRVAPQATVIGSTTAAADGNVSFFHLPGGVRTAISGLGVYYPDGRETQRVGIVPDITVQPTIKGIREDRDEVLEKAVAIINGK
jgi:C-terminal processing protease CtpA/Prc